MGNKTLRMQSTVWAHLLPIWSGSHLERLLKIHNKFLQYDDEIFCKFYKEIRYLTVTIFSQHFWLLWCMCIEAIFTELSCSSLERRFRRSRCALSAIIVGSWWPHMGKSCAHTALTSCSKIRNFQRKNNAIIVRWVSHINADECYMS